MHVTGIVAEYNPFHNGHLYQLNESKRLTNSDFVIAVMSGNFTQRGTPSVVNKFVRTQMALSAGIDMVLELPVPYATASAERFCEAAVSILNKTGIVNTLSFGSEIGDVNLLQALAHIFADEPAYLSELIKRHLSSGYSFPRARQSAIIDFFSHVNPDSYSIKHIKEAVENPNNILGIEYIKALIKFKTQMTPLTIKRTVSHYHDTDIYASIASATAIRTQLQLHHLESIKLCMPDQSYDLLLGHSEYMPSLADLNDFLHYKLIFSNNASLYSLWDIPQDIILSVLKCFRAKMPVQDIITAVTSKTYTRATIQRAIFRIMLNILEDDMEKLKPLEWTPYIRVLGCRKDATLLLSELTKHARVPVITNLKTSYNTLTTEGRLLLDYELKASNIYDYISKNSNPYNQDFTHPFIKL